MTSHFKPSQVQKRVKPCKTGLQTAVQTAADKFTKAEKHIAIIIQLEIFVLV